MKVPKTFLPKKNLDNKTQRLVEESYIIPKEPDIEIIKPLIYPEELEKLIEYRKYYRRLPSGIKKTVKSLHSKVDKAAEKTGYGNFRKNEKGYCIFQYYGLIRDKEKPKDMSILIRTWLSLPDSYPLAQYRYAVVHDDNIKEFCKVFERYERGGPMKYLTLSLKPKVEKFCIEFTDDDREALKKAFT